MENRKILKHKKSLKDFCGLKVSRETFKYCGIAWAGITTASAGILVGAAKNIVILGIFLLMILS